VLTQIIFEEESKGQNLLADPLSAPAQSASYGDSPAGCAFRLSRHVK